MAEIYQAKKEYSLSLKYLLITLEFFKKEKLNMGIAEALCKIGKIYIFINEFKKAESFLIQAYSFHRKINYKEIQLLLDIYRNFNLLYLKQRNFKKAYKYSIKINRIEKKILKDKNNTEILKLQSKYELEKKEQETKILKQKNQELSELNKKILDSIEYASLIQHSILPRDEEISQYIKDYFIIWKPRDIVGGDFYWFYPIPKSVTLSEVEGQNSSYIISVIDCTGHGVPGAFMSMTANSILNNIVKEKQIYAPDEILNLLHKEIRYTLRQQAKESQQDGMDISICYIDTNKKEIRFAGAMQALYLITENESTNSPNLTKIRGNRFSIGGRQKEEERVFTKHIIKYRSGDSIYMMSDGLADQKVRIDGKEQRFKTKRVEAMLLKYYSLPMSEQKKKILEDLARVQDDFEQRDDIVVIGLKLT